MSNETYKLRFWGVRGTAPTPEVRKLRYGGHTICASVSISPTEHVILDCGSGLRAFGYHLERTEPGAAHRFHVLFSHYHFDHVAGLPFFQPLYDPKCSFTFHGHDARGRSVRQVLESLIAPPYFPVTLSGAPARVEHRRADGSELVFGDLRVNSMPLYHPDGCLAYRLEHGERRIIFATDHEHGNEEIDTALVRFSREADYLIYDATYLPPEYESLRKGWGHSTWYAAVLIARAARVKTLVLFHHHPDHTDDELEAVERLAREELPSSHIAREGMELPF